MSPICCGVQRKEKRDPGWIEWLPSIRLLGPALPLFWIHKGLVTGRDFSIREPKENSHISLLRHKTQRGPEGLYDLPKVTQLGGSGMAESKNLGFLTPGLVHHPELPQVSEG